MNECMILYSPDSEKLFRMEENRENVVDRTEIRGKICKKKKKVEAGSETNSTDCLNLPAGIPATGTVFKTVFILSHPL